MKPILFSTPMVRALLAGKTQTRRIVKHQPPASWSKPPVWIDREGFWHSGDGSHLGTKSDLRSPFRVGDVLYVREAWATDRCYDHIKPRDLNPTWPVYYEVRSDRTFTRGFHRVRSSIHMPRWACRLFLRVTDVRAQRVQEITEDDAMAEGSSIRATMPEFASVKASTAREWFAFAWDSLHGPGAWARNDWVWAYTFERAAKEA